jgi:hypothetical protein
MALSRSSPRPCRGRVPRRRTATLPAPRRTQVRSRAQQRHGWNREPASLSTPGRLLRSGPLQSPVAGDAARPSGGESGRQRALRLVVGRRRPGPTDPPGEGSSSWLVRPIRVRARVYRMSAQPSPEWVMRPRPDPAMLTTVVGSDRRQGSHAMAAGEQDRVGVPGPSDQGGTR